MPASKKKQTEQYTPSIQEDSLSKIKKWFDFFNSSRTVFLGVIVVVVTLLNLWLVIKLEPINRSTRDNQHGIEANAKAIAETNSHCADQNQQIGDHLAAIEGKIDDIYKILINLD